MLSRFPRRELPVLQALFRRSLALSFLLLFAGWIVLPANAAIKLVQYSNKDAGTASASSLSFSVSNTAGNWIGVAVRAGQSGQMFGVSDTRGNTHQQAVQLNQTLDTPNGDTVAIFYAGNIGGGTKTVTVTKSITDTQCFAILKYSGVATTNSLNAIAAAQENGTSANSGSAAAAGDLVLGAVMTGDWKACTASNGFTGAAIK